MYDILILDARKTKEKYKYSPNNVHFIVPRPPQCHKKIMLRKLFTQRTFLLVCPIYFCASYPELAYLG